MAAPGHHPWYCCFTLQYVPYYRILQNMPPIDNVECCFASCVPHLELIVVVRVTNNGAKKTSPMTYRSCKTTSIALIIVSCMRPSVKCAIFYSVLAQETFSPESLPLFVKLQRLPNPAAGDSSVERALFSDSQVYSTAVSDRSSRVERRKRLNRKCRWGTRGTEYTVCASHGGPTPALHTVSICVKYQDPPAYVLKFAASLWLTVVVMIPA